MVDEGALDEDNGENGRHHVYHRAGGEGEFTVDLPHKEGGTITLTVRGDDGQDVELTFTVMEMTEPGEPTCSRTGAESLTANGVTLSNFRLEYAGEGENGHDIWTVTYDYALTGNQDHAHDKDYSSATPDETGFVSSDTVNHQGGAVKITVTDGTGDTVTGQIDIEVHNDVPVVTAVDPLPMTDPSIKGEAYLSGSFEVSFGADGMQQVPHEGEDGASMTDAPFRYVYTEGGKEQSEELVLRDGKCTLTLEGKGTLILTQGDGDKWSYEFQPVSGAILGEDDSITLLAVDGDNDTAPVTIPLILDHKPTVTDKDPGGETARMSPPTSSSWTRATSRKGTPACRQVQNTAKAAPSGSTSTEKTAPSPSVPGMSRTKPSSWI